MSLTDKQQMRVKQLLGLPTSSAALDERFAALTEIEEAEVAEIIEAFEPIRNQETGLDVEGYKRIDINTRARLRMNMAQVMGFGVTQKVKRIS